MRDVFTTIAGREIVWTDRAGTTHLCEGSDVHPGVRLIWTRCATKKSSATGVAGALDVPAGCAWLRRRGDWITCEACVYCKNGNASKEFVS